ncbi:nucleoside 2-deoxyribosyltransferase [Wenyingzhuangia sp.]|jgi:nucleoside 2-deoxyribosyltransferase|uniref:nucleoside 2-deoxyribosyltransferase n=1 Tax=Wenyingzhuangia sp. TaxID=1964193 RepID=UPI00321A5625
MVKNIYIAGPLFNVHEKKYLEEIAAVLEGAGYDCFLPHRDQTGIDPDELKDNNMSQSTKDIIFKTDIDALDNADLVIALVSGQDIDSGTASEIGYMYANKKPIIAITAWERRYRNLFTEGMFTKTIQTIKEVLPAVEQMNS